ncbi:hypothetical protein HBB16_13800 [Pseudonocardia sp. MCCB 268]|nr:hypothetical protein [Pseudonocardia cytotoxica]
MLSIPFVVVCLTLAIRNRNEVLRPGDPGEREATSSTWPSYAPRGLVIRSSRSRVARAAPSTGPTACPPWTPAGRWAERRAARGRPRSPGCTAQSSGRCWAQPWSSSSGRSGNARRRAPTHR